jgi:hypothetical protein
MCTAYGEAATTLAASVKLFMVSKTTEPVEKVAAGSIGGPKPSSKRSKTTLLVPEQMSARGTKEFFNTLD